MKPENSGMGVPPISPTTQASTPNWIPWEGGDCPVDPSVKVELMLKDGTFRKGAASLYEWRWRNLKSKWNIIAYRVIFPSREQTAPAPDPYQITLQGIKLDPYKIVELYGITSMPIAQALKKLLRCGRKHKSLAQDVRDAITSLQRWEELQKED